MSDFPKEIEIVEADFDPSSPNSMSAKNRLYAEAGYKYVDTATFPHDDGVFTILIKDEKAIVIWAESEERKTRTPDEEVMGNRKLSTTVLRHLAWNSGGQVALEAAKLLREADE